ncbi:hypothetical protein CRM22_005870 [Opisthorchis felineus]|uniref:Uncharacterized protein n=1 Tax=Opisthorchis felineus TaxID=147828 RepID=A0A4S2LP28_OPIFE|nr:hypothetical protein CRM22_005870 [Opisthorchis felineus]
MTKYLFAVAKVTSAVCVLWSAYLLRRLRRTTRHPDETCQSVTIKQMHDHPAFIATDNPSESSAYPSTTPGSATWSLLEQTRSYVHYGLRWITHIFQARRTAVTEQLALPSANMAFTTEEFNFYSVFLSDLAVRAAVAPIVRSMLSQKNRFRFLRAQNSPDGMLDSILSALVCFSKNDEFVGLLLVHEEFPKLIGRLTELVVQSLSPQAGLQDYPTSPLKTSITKSSADASAIVAHLPANDWPTATAHSVSDPFAVSLPPSVSHSAGSHPEYPLHLSFAHFLANLSRHSDSLTLVDVPGLSTLLSTWSRSPSLHLLLLCQKIQHNLSIHSLHRENATSSSATSSSSDMSTKLLYFPDIYRLDIERSINSDRLNSSAAEYDFDIIFVHGMRGSVFFTWRQNDAVLDSNETDAGNYTKCWPRDWLSREFPRARILAIDASLNPFIWDPICPVDRLERTMDNRAKKILPQLRAAGVGQRPIIWVTHSAGGILVKELLRLSEASVNQQPQTDGKSVASVNTSVSQIHTYKTVPSQLGDRHVFDVPTTDIPSVTVTWFCDPADQASSTQQMLIPSPTEETTLLPTTPTGEMAVGSTMPTSSSNVDLATGHKPTCRPDDFGLTRHSQGIVFMSAPHRGNRSLYGLYRRPIRWTLTPEAIQLERNSTFLLDLHSWFHTWATKSQLKVLSMIETQVTPINRFWSVLLVPEDEKDSEMGEVVYIDSDHMFISKPRNQSDPVYQRVVKFIRGIRDGQVCPTTCGGDTSRN